MRKSTKAKTSKGRAKAPLVDEGVSQALGVTVKFSVMERFLSEAVARFKESKYCAAVRLASQSVLKMEEKVRDYVRANWAIAITSANRLFDSRQGESEVSQNVRIQLEKAMEAFKDESYVRLPKLLEDLSNATENLYTHEKNRARKNLAFRVTALEKVQSMGGDTALARTSLRMAAQALDEDDWETYLVSIEEVDGLEKRLRELRIGELQEAAKSVASRFLEEVKRAIESGDLETANSLVGVTERATSGSLSKSKDETIVDVQEVALGKVRRLITRMKPLINKAQEEGFSTVEAMKHLTAAEELLTSGDHVSALTMAKKSYDTILAFRKRRAKEIKKAKSETEEKAVTKPLEKLMEEPVLWCSECGSINVEVVSDGEANCLDCGKVLLLTAASNP